MHAPAAVGWLCALGLLAPLGVRAQDLFPPEQPREAKPVWPSWSRQAAGPALAWAQKAGVVLYGDHERWIGNPRGWAASAVTTRAGIVLVGSRASRPVLAYLDAKGSLLWERDLSAPGFAAFEGASVLEQSDGAVVALVLSYVRGPGPTAARLVCVDAAGKLRWDRELRFRGFEGSAFPLVMKRGAGDALLLRGHLGVGGEKYVWWEGRVDAAGRVTDDRSLEPMEPGFRTWQLDRLEPTTVR